MKVVINQSTAPFGVSWDFLDHYNYPLTEASRAKDFRYSPELIEYIEKFGSAAASAPGAKLVVVNVPDNAKFRVMRPAPEQIEFLGA